MSPTRALCLTSLLLACSGPVTDAPVMPTDAPGDSDQDTETTPIVHGRFPGHPLSADQIAHVLQDALLIDIDVAALLPDEETSHGFTHIDDVQAPSDAWFIRAAGVAREAVDTVLTEQVVLPSTTTLLNLPAEELEWTTGLMAPLRSYRDTVWWIIADRAQATFVVPEDDTWHLQIPLVAQQLAMSNADVQAEVWLDGVLLESWGVDLESDEAILPVHLLDLDLVLSAGPHLLEIVLTPPRPSSLPTWTPGDLLGLSGSFVAVDEIRLAGTSTVAQTAASPARAALFTCEPEPDVAACATQILAPVLRRLWRRPVQDDELAGLVELVTRATESELEFADAVGLALEAALLSPSFLLHWEVSADTTPHPWASHATASRLAFAVWQSGPDRALLDCADTGGLGTSQDGPCGRTAQLTRLLEDPRAHRLTDEMGLRWLGIHELDRLWFGVEFYPQYSPALMSDLMAETAYVIAEFVDDDRDLRELVLTDHSWLNRRLGLLYEMPEVTSYALERTQLDPATRIGLLTHGSVLLTSSRGGEPNVARRASWLYNTLLCQELPAAPPNIPPLPPGATTAEDFNSHVSDPACAYCHAVIDPFGAPLQAYDALGAWHDSHLTSSTLPDGTVVDGPADLAAWLYEQQDFATCIVEHLFVWSTGRDPAEDERTTVLPRITAAALQDGFSMHAILSAIVNDPSFDGVAP